MPTLGFSELLVILMILLLVFGASRLPQLGEAVGRTIRGFKRGLSNDESIEVKRELAERESSRPADAGSGSAAKAPETQQAGASPAAADDSEAHKTEAHKRDEADAEIVER